MGAYSGRLADLERRLAVPGTTTRAEEIALLERIIVAELEVEEIMRAMAPTWAERTRKFQKPREAAERSIAQFEEDRRNFAAQHQQRLDELRALTGDACPDWEKRVARLRLQAVTPKRPRRTAAGPEL